MGQNAIYTGAFGLGCTRQQACEAQSGEHTAGCDLYSKKIRRLKRNQGGERAIRWIRGARPAAGGIVARSAAAAAGTGT